MTAFVIRRLLQAVPTLFFVSLIVFTIIHLTPGDPAQAMLGNVYGVTAEVIANVRHQMGLDQPIYVQYGLWVWHLLHGDFGRSYISHADVSTLIAQRLPASIELAVVSSILALLIAVPVGILSAVRRGTWFDHVATAFVTAGIAMPGFWLAILIVLLFAVSLKVLPPNGYVPLNQDANGNLRFLVLPAVTLAILVAAPTMRYLRSSMLDVLGEDYVRTARAKGLREQAVVYRHALKNALIPAITFVGLQFASLVGGSVMIEWVFGWPGIGWLAVHAVLSRDYLVVQGATIVVGAIFVLANLAVDVLYAVLDPRVHHG